MEGGADPRTKNQHGDIPLHTIIKTNPIKSNSWSDEKIKKAALIKQSCLVALLTYGNCDPNYKTKNGMTPLHLAVEVIALVVQDVM